MTTSLRQVARCLPGGDDDIAVRRDLVPAVESGNPLAQRFGLGKLAGDVSLAQVMRHLEWQRCDAANYLKMPVPLEHRSPSREEAQISVDGLVRRVSLFMGKSDWELDWHIYLDLDPDVHHRLARIGRLRDTLFCEWMVVNRWEREIVGRQWWSNDMDTMLALRWPLPDGHPEAETASDHWSWVENDHQGDESETVAALDNPERRNNSALIGGRVYLQGAFVKDDPMDDDEHNHLEIHPLDSIAYSIGSDGRVLATSPFETGWPACTVRWRVGAVTNSGFHRINQCSFVAKPRRTIWYLPLPSQASLPGARIGIQEQRPGFWHSPTNQRFEQRGVERMTVTPEPNDGTYSYSSFPADPSDGRRKLRIDVVMEAPDDWGGLLLRDYTITVVPPPSTP